MENEKQRSATSWEKPAAIVGLISTVVSIVTTLAEKGPLIGGFLGTLLFYLGSIVLGLYMSLLIFVGVAYVATEFASASDDAVKAIFVIFAVAGAIFGVYLGHGTIKDAETSMRIFLSALGLAAVGIPLVLFIRRSSSGSEGRKHDS